MNPIIQRLNEIKNNPSELSQFHIEVAYEYAKTADELGERIAEFAQLKMLLMQEHKTVAKAEQMFELSPEGIWETKQKIKLKTLEKVLSAVKRRIETFETESRNQF